MWTEAADIKRIAEGVERINSGKLNRKAIVLLVSYASKVNRAEVEAVLTGLGSLAKLYLK